MSNNVNNLIQDTLKGVALISARCDYMSHRNVLQQAAMSFKINKNWTVVGETYAKSGAIAENDLKDIQEACNDYMEAGRQLHCKYILASKSS